MQKNGADTALVVTFAPTLQTGSATGSVSVVEGDYIGIKITKSGVIGSPTDVYCTIG